MPAVPGSCCSLASSGSSSCSLASGLATGRVSALYGRSAAALSPVSPTWPAQRLCSSWVGFIPSILGGVKTPLEITKKVMIEGKEVIQSVKIQDSFDKILPFMLPLAVTFCVYWLLKKKHWTNLQVLLLLVVAGIILGACKIL